MTNRMCLVVLGAALLTTGCAKGSEPDPETSASDACAEEARQASGYRGVPVRTNARIQMRNDQKWVDFYRVYDECMRALDQKEGDD